MSPTGLVAFGLEAEAMHAEVAHLLHDDETDLQPVHRSIFQGKPRTEFHRNGLEGKAKGKQQHHTVDEDVNKEFAVDVRVEEGRRSHQHQRQNRSDGQPPGERQQLQRGKNQRDSGKDGREDEKAWIDVHGLALKVSQVNKENQKDDTTSGAVLLVVQAVLLLLISGSDDGQRDARRDGTRALLRGRLHESSRSPLPGCPPPG